MSKKHTAVTHAFLTQQPCIYLNFEAFIHISWPFHSTIYLSPKFNPHRLNTEENQDRRNLQGCCVKNACVTAVCFFESFCVMRCVIFLCWITQNFDCVYFSRYFVKSRKNQLSEIVFLISSNKFDWKFSLILESRVIWEKIIGLGLTLFKILE